MKKAALLAIALVSLVYPVFAGIGTPLSPNIMGTGGAGGVTASGYDSLFSNPAGFAFDRLSFTLLSVQPWVYTLPHYIPEIFNGFLGKSKDAFDSAAAGNLESNGFGIGGRAGLGWTGNGLGLGIALDFDTAVYSMQGVMSGNAYMSVSAVAGYAVAFSLGSDASLLAGVDARPAIRIRSVLSDSDGEKLIKSLYGLEGVLQSLFESSSTYSAGVAIDAGAILNIGRFSAGVSARDIGGTKYTYSSGYFGESLDNLLNGKLPPETGDVETDPLTFNAGLSYRFFGGKIKSVFDPGIYAEIHDVQGFAESIKSGASTLLYTHAGADVRVLSFLDLRAGLYQGYLTLGAGLNLPVAKLSAAYFTREMGNSYRERPSSGLTFEAALRF